MPQKKIVWLVSKPIHYPAVAHTAYKFFYKETAQNVKNHNPGVKFGDVSRIVGEMWGTLTDAEKEKYRKMAAEDKIR